MKRTRLFRGISALAVVGLLLMAAIPAFAAGPRVRVVHASPDAPAVDVWVDGKAALTNVPFKAISDYLALSAGDHKVQVVPTGKTEPAVISATLKLDPDKDYTVVAVGKLAQIEPLVLVDNNAAPAAGKAHVRFVHTSPDAPAVDIAVKGGPVIFPNVAFKGASQYVPVDAGTYDLEVRPAGKTDVVLAVPGVKLDAGNVYTVFAMGLVNGEPKLVAVPSVDVKATAASAAAAAPAAAATAPKAMPTTGGATDLAVIGLALAAALILVGGGLSLAKRPVRNR
jgi:hypothetical protein